MRVICENVRNLHTWTDCHFQPHCARLDAGCRSSFLRWHPCSRKQTFSKWLIVYRSMPMSSTMVITTILNGYFYPLTALFLFNVASGQLCVKEHVDISMMRETSNDMLAFVEHPKSLSPSPSPSLYLICSLNAVHPTPCLTSWTDTCGATGGDSR